MIQLQAQSNEAFVQYLDEPSSDISIGESVMRGSGLTSYVAYIVKVIHPIKITVERRYRQFDSLREALLLRWPGIYIPCLPPKHSAGNNNLKVVNERIKYLSYFLNCIAKVSYLFMSEQFQLFLNSNSSDLKKMYQKMVKPTYESIELRYEQIFPDLKLNLTQSTEIMNRVHDQLLPFIKELEQNLMYLVNIKKQLYKLAYRREEYLKRIGDIYSDALPQFEKYIKATCESSKLVLLEDISLRQKIGEVRISRGQSYWILYEAIRLEIGECKAAIESIQRRIDVEREGQRIIKKIASNKEQLDNIANKKPSIKSFFNSNVDELNRQLIKQNQFLQVQLNSIQILMLYVNELILRQLIGNYRAKRQKIWIKAFREYIVGEKQLCALMNDFFKKIQVI